VPESVITDVLLDLDRDLAGGEPIPAFKRAIKTGRALFAERFEQGADIRELVFGKASLIDGVLTRSWRRFMDGEHAASLVAVGGYGRGELHPASDIDLLILTEQDPQELAGRLEPFVMFLWDIGLEVGHSVRSIVQCVEEATDDITIATNLVESRLIAGEASLFERLMECTGPEHLWPTAEFFSAKLAEQRARYAKFDDSGQNLEPNLKEGQGGLRDYHTMLWIGRIKLGVRQTRDLEYFGYLSHDEYVAVTEALSFIWKVRNKLHLETNRKIDQLYFENQIKLAGKNLLVDFEGLPLRAGRPCSDLQQGRADRLADSRRPAARGDSLGPQSAHALLVVKVPCGPAAKRSPAG